MLHPNIICTNFLNDGWSRHLLQFPPIKRTICINRKKYFVSFPWILFSMCNLKELHGYSNRGLQIFFADEKVTSWDSFVYKTPLPNCNIANSVCLGKDIKAETEAELIKAVLARFWNSRFDGEYIDFRRWLREKWTSDRLSMKHLINWFCDKFPPLELNNGL